VRDLARWLLHVSLRGAAFVPARRSRVFPEPLSLAPLPVSP
jgi:hypothetical protein